MLVNDEALPQGSPEWLEWRRSGIGGSEIFSLACRARHWLKDRPALVAAVSPTNTPPTWVSTPRRIWMDKMGLLPPLKNNPHLERGHRVEPLVRELAEYTWNTKLTPVCGYADGAPYCRVSLDGYSEDAGILIEVKAPWKPWEHLPDYPVWQSAYQAAVLVEMGLDVRQVSILEGNEDWKRRVSVRHWPILADVRLPDSRFWTLGRAHAHGRRIFSSVHAHRNSAGLHPPGKRLAR
jgi:hypothetical protein